MRGVYIGVGSNIKPLTNIFKALEHLDRAFPILNVSTFYLTEPEGRPHQPAFNNGVVEVQTRLEPSELKFSILRKIENQIPARQSTAPNQVLYFTHTLLI